MLMPFHFEHHRDFGKTEQIPSWEEQGRHNIHL